MHLAASRDVPSQRALRELSEQQFTNVSACVTSQVENQASLANFRRIVTPKFGVPCAFHVWNVQVADDAIAQAVDSLRALLNHIAIPRIDFRVHGSDTHRDDITFLRCVVISLVLFLVLLFFQHESVERFVNTTFAVAVNFDRQQNFNATLLNQQRSRRNIFGERYPIDREKYVTLVDIDARFAEHTTSHVVPYVTLHNVRDAITADFAVPSEVSAEIPSRVSAMGASRITRRDSHVRVTNASGNFTQ